jgi:hypothetical protein
MPQSIKDLIDERNALQDQLNHSNRYKTRYQLQEQINVLDDLIDFELEAFEEERIAALVHLEHLIIPYQFT